MRVLSATSYTYPPQSTGGAWSSIHDMCLELQRREIAVGVVSAEAPLRSGGWLTVRNRILRRRRHVARYMRDDTRGYPVFRSRPPVTGVREVVDRFRPSVVVVQVGEAARLADEFLDCGVPTILYFRDAEYQHLAGEVRPRAGLGFMANSAYTAARAKQRFGVDAVVIPPMIRPESYRTLTRRRTVAFVNPHPKKGAEVALQLAESRPDIPFIFVESWHIPREIRRRYRERARAAGNIEWRRPLTDMREIYREARLVLVPSMWEEAWCRVVSEAQLSGIPVLASQRGGLPESVGPGGLLVDPDGPLSAWEEGLAALWDDGDRYARLSAEALSHSERREFQPDSLVTRFIDTLRDHVAASAGTMSAQ